MKNPYRIMKNIFIPIVRMYFRLRSWWPFWFYILNREGRNLYKKKSFSPGATEERIVSAFKKDGIAISHLDELFPERNFLSYLGSYARELSTSAATRTSKEFLQNLWDAVPLVDFDNPFLEFSLQEQILAVVNGYMDLCVKFYYMTLNITTPVDKGSLPVQSQQWHRDPEDKKMVKIFLYLNDVDEEAGPFMYVRGSQYGGKLNSIFMQKPPRGSSYISDKDIAKSVPSDAILKCTGKAGTLIFCDTAGLHKGGYALSKDRIMFTAGFCSRASVWPRRYRTPKNFRNKLAEMPLSNFARYALDFKLNRLNVYFLRKIKKNLPYEF